MISQQHWRQTLIDRALHETGDVALAIVAAELALEVQPFPEDDADLEVEDFVDVGLAWTAHGTGVRGQVVGKKRWVDSETGQIRYQEIQPGTRRAALRPPPAAGRRPTPATNQPRRSAGTTPPTPATRGPTTNVPPRPAVPTKPAPPAKPAPQIIAKQPQPGLGEAVFAGQRIKTLQSTADNPLSAQSHSLASRAHAQAASTFRDTGNANLAAAHDAAAKYHASLAQKKTAPLQSRPPAQPSKPATMGEHGKNFVATVDASLKESKSLIGRQRRDYAASMNYVVSRMPERAIENASRNLRNISWYGSTKELTNEVARRSPGLISQKDLEDGIEIAGTFGMNGVLSIDGERGYSSEYGEEFHTEERENAHETYAHELTHAVDGPSFIYSSNANWKKAWEQEIKQPDSLSLYAKGSAYEGFAEFGRLVYGTNIDRKKIEAAFPVCSTFWKKAGLWQ